MTVFTQLPDALTLLRTLLALAAFVFLPGYFAALARRGKKNFFEFLAQSPAEALAESVFVSLCGLAFFVFALMWSIGFTALGLLVLEIAFLAGTWWYWKKTT